MEDGDRHRGIADHLNDVVWMTDAAFEEVVFVNPTYEEATGRDDGGAGGTIGSLELVHPEDREEFGEWMAAVRRDEAATARDRYETAFRAAREDGEEHWIETVVVPVRDGDEVVAFAGVTADATERIDHERELRERIERLDQFASMVSHDLRNPLAVAHAHLELFRETGDESHLDGIEDALGRIDGLASELLALARHGEAAGERTRQSLRSVAAAAWEGTETREATLAVDDDLAVEAERTQLRLLLENLFRNAVGHGGDDVTVRIGAVEGGFFVEDAGSGIPPEERERVFEHGYTTGYSGTGIGLTVVRHIAEAHGWSVRLTESDEGGAWFEFRPDGGG